MAPAFPQRLETGQWGAGIVPIVDNRPGVGAKDRRIIVDCMDPEIQEDVHFRAFAGLDQLVGFPDREKEKAGILFAGIMIFQRRIVFLPVCDPEPDQAFFLQQRIGNAAFLLEMRQNGNRLVLEPAAEPVLQF